jgi:hypothetical protein
MKKAYEILNEEPEGKLAFVRPRRRWTDNNDMNSTEIRWKRANRIHLAENVKWC